MYGVEINVGAYVHLSGEYAHVLVLCFHTLQNKVWRQLGALAAHTCV